MGLYPSKLDPGTQEGSGTFGHKDDVLLFRSTTSLVSQGPLWDQSSEDGQTWTGRTEAKKTGSDTPSPGVKTFRKRPKKVPLGEGTEVPPSMSSSLFPEPNLERR